MVSLSRSSYEQSLEYQLAPLAFSEIDTEADSGFDRESLSPNEYFPEQMQDHLEFIRKGVVVSCGTERSFFTLLACPEDSCEALVVVDVNPRVKAYVDTNILLLRLAEDRNEYQALLATNQVGVLTHKIRNSNLPEKIKEYYLQNLENFCYYFYSHADWREKPFSNLFLEKVRYDLDDGQFNRLQQYARAGKIVSIVGSINDLSFLGNRKVSAINLSNIGDYSFVNLTGPHFFETRVIRTIYPTDLSEMSLGTVYHSYCHYTMYPEQREEFETLLSQIQNHFQTGKEHLHQVVNRILNIPLCLRNPYNDGGWATYSTRTLNLLRTYVKEHFSHD